MRSLKLCRYWRSLCSNKHSRRFLKAAGSTIPVCCSSLTWIKSVHDELLLIIKKHFCTIMVVQLQCQETAHATVGMACLGQLMIFQIISGHSSRLLVVQIPVLLFRLDLPCCSGVSESLMVWMWEHRECKPLACGLVNI